MSRSIVILLVMLSAGSRAAAEPSAELAQALTLHASFDSRLDADFSRGDRVCYVRQAGQDKPAAVNDELQLVSNTGRFGGALHFPKKGTTRPQFKGDKVLNYNDQSWSATVSVWLRLDPDKDLEPGYCDPVQIIGNDSKQGFIFLEWSKDETPRFFRYAIRPLIHIWNPSNVPWDQIPFDKRPMVQVARAPFSRNQWTHCVFTLAHINDKQHQPSGQLYVNAQSQGKIENWDLTFGWDPSQVLLVLGASYVGHLDDLAVFNRALSAAEVQELFGLKSGAGELHR